MTPTLFLLFIVIGVTLFFDYSNGFHDTANAIANSVSTGTISPRRAVLMAAVLNFLGAVTIGTAVAKTIGKGILTVDPAHTPQWLVLAAITAAISWNLLTWYFGLPSSSSHALIGGVMGAGVAGYGWKALNLPGIAKIVESLIFSPLLGFGVAFAAMVGLIWLVFRARPSMVSDGSRILQVLSSAFLSFSHGSNDAQKSMGIITMALVGSGVLKTFSVPLWVMVLCATAMGLGTLSGGWRIIKTMGTKIVKLQAFQGFTADFATAGVILSASHLGLPVSTTHVITGSIMGVGATRRLSAVRWGVAGNIVLAWIMTIPITACLAWALYGLLKLIFRL